MRSRPIRRFAFLAMATVLVACSGLGGTHLVVTDAWVRPALPGAESAAYLKIENAGLTGDTLLSVDSPDAAMAELHGTSTDPSGMTGMTPMDELTIPAGESVTLAPGAMHVMLTGLTHPLTVGGTVELRLVFRHAGTMTIQAAVRTG